MILFAVFKVMISCFLLASDNSQRFRETCFAFALTPQQVQQISSSMWVCLIGNTVFTWKQMKKGASLPYLSFWIVIAEDTGASENPPLGNSFLIFCKLMERRRVRKRELNATSVGGELGRFLLYCTPNRYPALLPAALSHHQSDPLSRAVFIHHRDGTSLWPIRTFFTKEKKSRGQISMYLFYLPWKSNNEPVV